MLQSLMENTGTNGWLLVQSPPHVPVCVLSHFSCVRLFAVLQTESLLLSNKSGIEGIRFVLVDSRSIVLATI